MGAVGGGSTEHGFRSMEWALNIPGALRSRAGEVHCPFPRNTHRDPAINQLQIKMEFCPRKTCIVKFRSRMTQVSQSTLQV